MLLAQEECVRLKLYVCMFPSTQYALALLLNGSNKVTNKRQMVLTIIHLHIQLFFCLEADEMLSCEVIL